MFCRNSISFFLVLCLFAAVSVESFFIPHHQGKSSVGWRTTSTISSTSRVAKTCIRMSDKDEQDRLRSLGYSEDEIRRRNKDSDPEQLNVRVDLVDDVDSVTLTAIGFGLIALNFFVFANMGDGGIAGLVATFINTVNN